MPVINVVTDNDIDQQAGLLVEDGKLKAKIDGTSITLNADGALTATQTVDVKLEGVELLPDNNLEFTLSDGTKVQASVADLVDVDTNTFTESAEFTTGALKIKLNDGTVVTASLSPVLPAMNNLINQAISNERGDEVQDLAGNQLGFLMKAQTTAP